MHRFKFTLSLRTRRDEPGQLLTIFELDARSAETFAQSLALPWPPESPAFRKGQLEIAVQRLEHVRRP